MNLNSLMVLKKQNLNVHQPKNSQAQRKRK